jgi:hypothetical protein
MSIGDMY